MKKFFLNEALKTLKDNKLRLTKQRVSLVTNILKNGDRHLTAEILHNEMINKKYKISLATVYNTLHDLEKVGLLRQVKVNSNHKYFDTNIYPHHHFYDETNNILIDIPLEKICITDIPIPPKNKKISEIEVIISLKNKS